VALSGWSLLREAAGRWVDDHCTRLGAALSYYAIFSLFPLSLLSISVIGVLLGDRATVRAILLTSLDTGSPQVHDLLDQTLTNLQTQRTARGLGALVGAVTLLFGASGVFSELDNALAVIWRVHEVASTSTWRSVLEYLCDRGVAFLLVVMAALVVLASLVTGTVLSAVSVSTGTQTLGWIWVPIELSVSAAFLTVLFAALFRYLPRRDHVAWRYALAGGALTSLLVSVLKRGLGFYLAHMGGYAAYGVVGAMLALLTWIYLTSFALLFGAELTVVSARRLTEWTQRSRA
jgi:membrane protein